MVIFQTHGVITPNQDKTNIKHIFTVEENIKCIKITYEYSPKTVENEAEATEVLEEYFKSYNEKKPDDISVYLPVKNLVTLSVDENGKYRGAAHRQADYQEHIIGEDFASVGFFKGKISSGEWDIVLNAHCVKCDVSYNIKVEGEKI